MSDVFVFGTSGSSRCNHVFGYTVACMLNWTHRAVGGCSRTACGPFRFGFVVDALLAGSLLEKDRHRGPGKIGSIVCFDVRSTIKLRILRPYERLLRLIGIFLGLLFNVLIAGAMCCGLT